MGEGEQGLIYYINKLKNWGFLRTLVYTTDTDIFAYLATNWDYLGGVSVMIRFHHFYMGKIPNNIRKNESCMYVCSFSKIAEMIKEMYPHLHRPVFTYYVFWGIFLGCDFIKGVHKTIQKYCSFYGKGAEETDQLLDYFFNYKLKFIKKYQNPQLNKKKSEELQPNIDKIFKIKMFLIKNIKCSVYDNNIFYSFKLNIKKALQSFLYYRKRYKLPLLKRAQKLKLIATCLNTNYVCEYFINHHRIKNPLHRRKYIPCDSVDNDGCNIYGYKKSEGGKIVQSLNIPKKFLIYI